MSREKIENGICRVAVVNVEFRGIPVDAGKMSVYTAKMLESYK